MRCHLNVKQAEPRPHAAIRYEVTDGVCARQKWMAGEGGGRRQRRRRRWCPGGTRPGVPFRRLIFIKGGDQKAGSAELISCRLFYILFHPPTLPPRSFASQIPHPLLLLFLPHLPARTATHRNLSPSALIERLLSPPCS